MLLTTRSTFAASADCADSVVASDLLLVGKPDDREAPAVFVPAAREESPVTDTSAPFRFAPRLLRPPPFGELGDAPPVAPGEAPPLEALGLFTVPAPLPN